MRRLAVLGSFLLALTLSQAAFGQTRSAPAAKQKFVEVVIANFKVWDANGDGALNEDELTREIQDPQLTGDNAAAAAAIKTSLRSKKAPKFPPLTIAYFQSDDPTLAYLVTAFRRAENRLKKGSSAELFTTEAPTLSGCKQGALGDCYLLAATGAVINRDPGVVTKMIHVQEDNGAYHVTYADGIEVDVPALTQGEMAMGGADTGDGLWLRILEKAWGERKIKTSAKLQASAEPSDVMGRGGSVRAALQAMTGHVAKGYRLGGAAKGANVELDSLRAAIQQAMDSRHLIGAGTPKTVRVPGISPNHAYAIIGYDRSTDSLLIWNPHVNKFKPKGNPGLEFGYPTEEGKFYMPLADFRATYSGVSIETDQPVKPPKLARI